MAVPQDFIKSLSLGGGYSSPAHFEVTFFGSPHWPEFPFKLRCHQAVLPGLTAATRQNATGMPEKNNPYRATFEDITLGFYCTEDLVEREYFEQWQAKIFPTLASNENPRWRNWPIGYRENYTQEIHITKLSFDGLPTKTYILHKAFPVTINETQLEWGQEEILKIEVIFSYDWWKLNIENIATGLTALRKENEFVTGHDIQTDRAIDGQAEDAWRKHRNDNPELREPGQAVGDQRSHYDAKGRSSSQQRTEYRQRNDEVRSKISVTEKSIRNRYWLLEDDPRSVQGPPAPTSVQKKQSLKNDMGRETLASNLGNLKPRHGTLAAGAMKAVPTASPSDARTKQALDTGFAWGNFKKKTRSF